MGPKIGGMDGTSDPKFVRFSGCVTPEGRKSPFFTVFRVFSRQNPGKSPLSWPGPLKMAKMS